MNLPLSLTSTNIHNSQHKIKMYWGFRVRHWFAVSSLSCEMKYASERGSTHPAPFKRKLDTRNSLTSN